MLRVLLLLLLLPPLFSAAHAGEDVAGRWLFTPADIEAGLDPHLGWVGDGMDRFSALFLVCSPANHTVRLALETDPGDAGSAVSRRLEHGAGAEAVAGTAEDHSGATWVSVALPYAVAASLLAAPGPWRLDGASGRLPGPDDTAALGAFRRSCGLPER
ncbi:hypothetical protein ACRC7T_03355 [Segnochrobactraceae bacterium EtOH-i3]